MSSRTSRHEPKIIALATLSTIFPSRWVNKILKENNIDISERTLRRAKEDLHKIGMDKVVHEMNRALHVMGVSNVLKSENLQDRMFEIINNQSAEDGDKIKAASLIWQITKDTPELVDHSLADALNRALNILDKKENNSVPLQKDNTPSGPC